MRDSKQIKVCGENYLSIDVENGKLARNGAPAVLVTIRDNGEHIYGRIVLTHDKARTLANALKTIIDYEVFGEEGLQRFNDPYDRLRDEIEEQLRKNANLKAENLRLEYYNAELLMRLERYQRGAKDE